MQSLSPATIANFREKVKVVSNELKIFIDPDWIDLCDLDGKNYLINASYSKGQEKLTHNPVAARISVTIDDTDGKFHAENPAGSYKTYLKTGRKIQFSTGFEVSDTPKLWQRFEGVISDITRDNLKKEIRITGFDYTQYLTEVRLKRSTNYWGANVIESTVQDQAKYPMPVACNGTYVAYLDGVPIYEGEHWVYNRADNEFIFLPDHVPGSDGVNDLLIYYFTDQVPENVIADILVIAGLYDDRAAVFADMDYTETGIILPRVWFASGDKCLNAIKKICERCNYQFYFKYNNKPVFNPPSTGGEWKDRVFTFTKDLITDPDYKENIDEVRTHIEIEGEKYSKSDFYYKTVSGKDILNASIEDRHIKEVVCDLPYETQEIVAPGRDVIVPFYVPATMLAINYVYLNLYFPGLQGGDYPFNSPHIYIRPTDRGAIFYKQGAYERFEDEFHLDAGTLDTNADYWWERIFLRYHIAPLFGFNIDMCEIQWLMFSEAVSGASTKDVELAEIADFGLVDKDIWGTAVNNDYGVVQSHGDTQGAEYNHDISARVATLLAAGTPYACYRFKSNLEDTETTKANFFRYSEPLLYAELSEDTAANVSVYWNNGAGYVLKGNYNSDQENIDLTAHFSGAGKKLLKFTCDKSRRIDALIRIGLTLDRT